MKSFSCFDFRNNLNQIIHHIKGNLAFKVSTKNLNISLENQKLTYSNWIFHSSSKCILYQQSHPVFI